MCIKLNKSVKTKGKKFYKAFTKEYGKLLTSFACTPVLRTSWNIAKGTEKGYCLLPVYKHHINKFSVYVGRKSADSHPFDKDIIYEVKVRGKVQGGRFSGTDAALVDEFKIVGKPI